MRIAPPELHALQMNKGHGSMTQLPGDARIQFGCKVRLYGQLS